MALSTKLDTEVHDGHLFSVLPGDLNVSGFGSGRYFIDYEEVSFDRYVDGIVFAECNDQEAECTDNPCKVRWHEHG